MDITYLSDELAKVSKDYTTKFGIKADNDWFMLKLQEEVGELTQAYLMMSERARKKGKNPEEIKEAFAKEIADVLGHILLLAKYNNIDIQKEMNEKWLVWNKK